MIPLNAEKIQQSIDHPAIGKIHVFDSLDSTNTWALNNAQCGEACLAEQQTAGRGRRGKQWHSPKQENLYLSFKWCFDELPKHIGLLSLWVGIALAETLKAHGVKQHGIKWPNDCLYQGKKLAGILLESKSDPRNIVIGIGINTAMQNTNEIDQPYTSLQSILDKPIDRNQLTSQLLIQLAGALHSFPNLSFNEISHSYQKWDLLKGKNITVLSEQQKISGVAKSIITGGLLLVQLDNGKEVAYSAGDVSIKPYL